MRRHTFSQASVARAVICACLIIEVSFAPPGQYNRVERELFSVYVVLSTLGLIGDLWGWRTSLRSLLILPRVDVGALGALGFISLVATLNPIVPSLQFALVLLSLREGSILPERSARYGVAIGTIVAAALAAWYSDAQLDPARVWQLFALVALAALSTFAVAWYIAASSVRQFVVDEGSGITDTLADAAAYAMEHTRSRSATLIWHNPDRAESELRGFGTAASQTIQGLNFVSLSKLNELRLMVFDLRQDAFMTMSGDGASVRDEIGVPNPELWRQLGMSTGLCMPIGEAADRACLILPTGSRSHWTDLIAAERIRNELNQGLRLHRRVIEGREVEISRLRNAIARDLHDSVAQTLAGARLMLSAIAGALSGDDKKRDLETIRESLYDEGVNLRDLIRQLRNAPDSGTRYDLIEELDKLLAAAGSRWKIAAELTESQFRLLVPDWLSLEIQQLVREAISNSVRHGGADRVAVTCNRKRGEIYLSICDNGKGFDVKQQKPPRSITERVAELSGTTEFCSKPGKTTVTVRLPSVEF